MVFSFLSTSRHTPITRVAGAVAGALLAVGLAAACSSSTEVSTGDAGQVSTNPVPGSLVSTTTTAPDGSATVVPGDLTTTTTSAAIEPPVGSSTSVLAAEAVPVTSALPKDPSIETQVFWVRGPDDDRVIDLPGYRDPTTGAKPLVLYGSVTNVGTAPVVNPLVTATWLDGEGVARAAFVTPVLAPAGTEPLAVLEPGAMGDVILVITDPDQIDQLGDLAAELRVASS